MKTSVIGYPKVGILRELKFATEQYFRNEINEEELQGVARQLKEDHWKIQKENGIDYISSNDFSFYDNLLDLAVLFNAVPNRYKELELSDLDKYFAMARGYQGDKGDVKALAMKKWFNTNYHYLVPEIDDDAEISLVGSKPFDDFIEAKNHGIDTNPTIIGAFTFLKLARFTGNKDIKDFTEDVINGYIELLNKFNSLGAKWIEIQEPYLVTDLSQDDVELFEKIYTRVLAEKGNAQVVLQTYFGDIRDAYKEAVSLPFDGIGLDFSEGKETLNLVKANGFPDNKTLFAGLVNGKNIWRNNYSSTVNLVKEIREYSKDIVINTSCSLAHVPYTLKNETILSDEYKKHLAFAEEKLVELSELKTILLNENVESVAEYKVNIKLFTEKRDSENTRIQDAVSALSEDDFTRLPEFEVREGIQREKFNFPLLPTTTIGSFPQTQDVKANRSNFKKGKISYEEYVSFNKAKIADCIELQEEIGLDILVHGEFERNDMVEYFGENLEGFIFTEKAWVQSYGTRCVKPPVVWGDVSRREPITVDYSVYAQSLSDKYVKGMLTGPVTILNWSFPREDISLKDSTFQIALAIRDEVLDLEANGIKIIQIDEAALREKLPLRESDWHSEYLDWAIPAFRLVHSDVQAETQIHTHMCYSEFEDIIHEIDNMDADVITFEASRSDLSIIETLEKCGFKTQVGPGAYDIHSPRVPSVQEIKEELETILEGLPKEKLWVNPDCGLKTRGNGETVKSLKNLVIAAKEVRKSLTK